MKKIVCILLQFFCIIILISFQNGYSQENVLAMQNGISYLDTNISLKSMLLDSGDPGEATIEFWAKFEDKDKELLLTSDDLNNSFNFIISASKVNFKTTTSDQTLSIPPTTTGMKWKHFVFTFYKTTQTGDIYTIDLFVDGNKIVERDKIYSFEGIAIPSNFDLFFAKKQEAGLLLLSEIRAWKTKFSEQEVKDFQYVFFTKETDLSDRIDKGLVAAYSGSEVVDFANDKLKELNIKKWTNKINRSGYPTSANFVSNLTKGKILSTVSTVYGNPNSDLNEIHLKVSKGEFPNNITITWYHPNNTETYTITRDEIFLDRLDSQKVTTGAIMKFEDKTALPGVVYSYKVEGKKMDGSYPKWGADEGFISPNGVLTGTIKTQSQVNVSEASVEIELTSPNSGIRGNSILFKSDSPSVNFEDDGIFFDGNKIFQETTVEFWYKNNNQTAENSILQIGNTKIALSSTETIVNFGGTLQKINVGSMDNSWHHYAFVLGSSDVLVYKDKVLKEKLIGKISRSSDTVIKWSINPTCASDYFLDQVRIWKGKRNAETISKYASYVVNADEKDLLLDYSFDIKLKREIYNRASGLLGEYIGTSSIVGKTFTYSYLQPLLKYIAFTNEQGLYAFNSIYATSPNGDQFTAKAAKPVHAFRPETVGFAIKQSTLSMDKEKTADFTDISELPLSGRIYYFENKVKYPVPAGKVIAIDDRPVYGIGTGLQSDPFGMYSISAPLGKHIVTVSNPSELSNTKQLKSLSFLSADAKDLSKGQGYAISKLRIPKMDTNGITLSGFVKPYTSVTGANSATQVQTLLQWGNYKITLFNKNIQFLYKELLQKETTVADITKFSFFGLSIGPDGNYNFLVGDTYKSGLINNLSDEESNFLSLGASVSTAGTLISNDNVSNLALIELRRKKYDKDQLRDIKVGDLIAGDQDVLEYSFEFDQEKGTRLLSKTKKAKDNYLDMKDKITINNTAILTYSKKMNYNYVAVNTLYNPQGNKYDINIVDPLTGMDFEMKDRYSFIGNIVIPCNYSIGEWTGTIKRTDSTSPEFIKPIGASNFNADNNIFIIDGLVPGQYQIVLINKKDTSIKLTSPIIDLTKESKSFDFEYNAPLHITAELYDFTVKGIGELAAGKLFPDLKETEHYNKLTTLCDTKIYTINDTPIIADYALEAGKKILIKATVYQIYNEEKKCSIKDATVSFLGDMVALPSNKLVSSNTNIEGITGIISFVANPNFVNPYTRNLRMLVEKSGSNANTVVQSVITGAKMTQSDFSVYTPIVDVVLHDPPGDGSSCKLKQGTKFSKSIKFSGGAGFEISTGFKTGIDFDMSSVVGFFGMGTEIKSMVIKTNIEGTTGAKFSGAYNHVSTWDTELTTTYSTNPGGSIVGKKADLFIGEGMLLLIGSGESITAEGCKIVKNSSTPVIDTEIKERFAHSYYDIKRVMIPNLLRIINDETKVSKKESYRSSAKDWLNLLINNDYALNDYVKDEYKFITDLIVWKDPTDKNFFEAYYTGLPESFDKLNTTVSEEYNWKNYSTLNYPNGEKVDNFDKSDISFDGGGSSITQTISNNHSQNNGGMFTFNFDYSIVETIAISLTGFENSIKNTNKITANLSTGQDIINSESGAFEYTLTDDDGGDRFAIQIRKDPKYNVPIFKTVAGQSQCPAEINTQLRFGVDLSVENPIATGLKGETLKYKIKLRNTQTARDEIGKTYKLSLRSETNPKGAVVKVNGTDLTIPGSATSFWFPVLSVPTSTSTPAEKDRYNATRGVLQEQEVIVEVTMPDNETATDMDYENLKFLYEVPCENRSDIDFDHNRNVYTASGTKSAVVFYLTAKFRGPCIDKLNMQMPQNNWVINAVNEDSQNVLFTIPGTTVGLDGKLTGFPDNLTAIDIEYALKNNNTPNLLKSILLKDLKSFYSSSDRAFKIKLDVSGLADGEYGIRLTPICGVGQETWRRNKPTDFAYGLISRISPNLLETNPVEGGLLTKGAIAATFDKALDPTTLNSMNVALRGTLGGIPKKLISADFKKNSKVTVPYGSFLDLPGSYTLEFWINPSAYPVKGEVNILSKGTNYTVSLDSIGKISLMDGKDMKVQSTSVASLPLYEWTHVALIHEAILNTTSFYFNGQLGGIELKPFTPNAGTNGNDLIIGGPKNDQGFIGQLDELRIWGTRRNDSDIVTYKNRQLLGNETNLKAYYTFDNNAVEVVGFKEAVRDYTGNTRGSTSTELYWIEDQAAPLSFEYLVQDVPITVSTTIDKNQIIINPLNFQTFYLEGAKLTAILSDNRIKGTDGNVVKETSWSFMIDKNNVAWSKANIIASQSVDKSIPIEAFLKNSGGTNATYELQSLPEWLTCSTRVVGKNTPLNSGFEEKLTFLTSSNLNKGTYVANIGVITYDKSGAKTGYEYFALELTVDCVTPDYSFNIFKFKNKKDIIAKINVDNAISADPNDILIAYYGDEIRGVTRVTNLNNKNVFFLNVYYNDLDDINKNLRFIIWKDSNCKEYLVNYTISIGNGDSVGSIGEPYSIIAKDTIVRKIHLNQGYQWVSFNVVDSAMDPNSLFSINSINGMDSSEEIIERMTNKGVIYNSDKNPIGELKKVDFKQGYLLNLHSEKDIFLTGVEAPNSTNIQIIGGNINNYIGYIPSSIMEVKHALKSLITKLSLGDRISGRDGYAEYTDQGWSGSLNYLRPNESYLLKMKNDGILNYLPSSLTTGKSVTSKTSASNTTWSFLNEEDKKYLKDAVAKGVVVNPKNYPFMMSITGVISSDFMDVDKEYLLVAVSEGDFRGVAKPILINNKWTYFMSVYGEADDTIKFNLIADEKKYNINQTVSLKNDEFLGSTTNPYVFKINQNLISKDISTNQILTIDTNPVKEMATVTIKPAVNDYYQLDIYNMSGAKVLTMFKEFIDSESTVQVEIDRKSNFGKFSSGLYICVLRGTNKNSLEVLKIIFE